MMIPSYITDTSSNYKLIRLSLMKASATFGYAKYGKYTYYIKHKVYSAINSN